MIRRLFSLIPVLLLLIGCGSASPPDVPTAQPISIATEAVAPTITPTRGPTRTPALIIPSTIAASPLIAVPPGLMYITGGLDATAHPLWVVDSEGRTRQLQESVVDQFASPDFDISADGTEMLYAFEGDIWRLDLASGTAFNLTNTPDRIEKAPRWLGTSRAFVCGSAEAAGEGGPTAGQLTYVNLDELTYRVVDEASLSSLPAPHPNGEMVLYSTHASEAGVGGFDLKEFNVADETITPVDAAAYGLSEYVITTRPDAPDALYTGSLSWNADGSKLGMALHGEIDGVERGIILVMDWASKTHEVIHISIVPGIEAPFFNSAPRFPLQADWLLFQAPPANFGNFEVLLADAGDLRGVSGDLILRGQWAETPTISLDDRWVAFLTSGGLALMRAGDWQAVVINAPDEVIGVGWVTPPE